MGMLRFLLKWSLQITGSLIVGYNYALKPEQQADLYGFYRSCFNSYRAGVQVYAALNEYKTLVALKDNPQEYTRQLSEVNSNTARRLEDLSRINRGVYMRLGQYLGHLRFAFPGEFYAVLKDLNENPNYPVQDYKYLKKHIEAQLGKTTKQTFQTLNTSPVKSQLFYQVYKAELAENFLDVNLKVIHPYAKSQAKWDFWFLSKVLTYVENFKTKNFTQNYPLYLDLFYANLKNGIEKELNFVEQQKTALQTKKNILQIVDEQKGKTGARALPIYAPHIYSQYTKEKLMIQEYFEGYHMSNSDALFKENFNKKSIASDFVGIWNSLFEKQRILLEAYTPSNLFIRKSRANEEGSYQLCLLNLANVSILPEFFVQPYVTLWKEFISNKKINPKKPQQRIESVRTFYEGLPLVYFSLFLKESDKVLELAQKAKLSPVSESSALAELAQRQLPKQLCVKLQQNKLLPVSKSKAPVKVQPQTELEYKNLRRAFELEYTPWKLEILFKTYKEIFREQKHFGVF